ncbi:hypothetical protein [Arthrobacter sp. 260]|uniref:hypothetical protein n=1 Tax=Arthrobacter sp. 260 TaxID=2735314 RepID=UPI001490C5D4|nr:hypothetical protein [Arthrobacter sp. 260]NOJ61026.1 hypothetical protein [Arthrobacter sp. 260]
MSELLRCGTEVFNEPTAFQITLLAVGDDQENDTTNTSNDSQHCPGQISGLDWSVADVEEAGKDEGRRNSYEYRRG